MKSVLDPMRLNTFCSWEKCSPPMFQLICTAPLYSASSKRRTNCLVKSYIQQHITHRAELTGWTSVRANHTTPICTVFSKLRTNEEPWCSPPGILGVAPAGRWSQTCLWWSINLWDSHSSLQEEHTNKTLWKRAILLKHEIFISLHWWEQKHLTRFQCHDTH